MMVALTIKQMSYVVLRIFDDFVRLLSYLLFNIKFFGCDLCFSSAIARKGNIGFPKFINYSSGRLSSYFQARVLPLNPVIPIDAIIVLF